MSAKNFLFLICICIAAGCGPKNDGEDPIEYVGGKPFPICKDINSRRVRVQTTSSTEGGPAFSTLTQGGLPLIVFNVVFMQAIAHSDAMFMFVYEHECGHHALGHLQEGEKSDQDLTQKGHFKQELDADCFAIKKMKKMGYDFSGVLSIIDDIYPWPKDPEHPSGKVRSRHLSSCFRSSAQR
jgi:hypothetical protein